VQGKCDLKLHFKTEGILMKFPYLGVTSFPAPSVPYFAILLLEPIGSVLVGCCHDELDLMSHRVHFALDEPGINFLLNMRFFI
jgi:hypothetical protein